MKIVQQKITPHLWFDTEAKEAAEFYVSSFGGDSKILSVNTIEDTPSGDAETVSFRLLDLDMMAISAGPYFKFNPSISFFVNFDPSQDPDAKKNLDSLWEKLSEGGTALMPLDSYPFSEHFGWIQDRFGLSWQLILTDPAGEIRPAIAPALLFTQDRSGQAEEAMNFYLSVFPEGRKGNLFLYGADSPPGAEGKVMFEDFLLYNLWFGAMDSPQLDHFVFNEAISFIVLCDTQKEIDFYWEKLSAVPEAEQCGWCKDRFGISWQVLPSSMNEMLRGSSEERNRVTQSFLKMKKLDVAELERAFRREV